MAEGQVRVGRMQFTISKVFSKESRNERNKVLSSTCGKEIERSHDDTSNLHEMTLTLKRRARTKDVWDPLGKVTW